MHELQLPFELANPLLVVFAAENSEFDDLMLDAEEYSAEHFAEVEHYYVLKLVEAVFVEVSLQSTFC